MTTRTEGTRYPWYKERLQWKYLANQQRQLNTLISHKWRFLVPSKEGPGASCPESQDLSEKPPLVLPLIYPKPTGQSDTRKRPAVLHHSSKNLDISKLTPGRQARQERINNIEKSLLETITAINSDDDFTPLIRDSQKPSNYTNNDEQVYGEKEHSRGSEEQLSDDREDIPITLPGETKPDQDTIYHWPLLKSAQEIAEEELEMAKRRAVSPTQEAQVNKVTNELIEWSKNLGDDSKEYIDENTIKRLFASDYEAKPVLTAPIHIVELKNVPHELRTESRGYTGSSSYRIMSAIDRLKLMESSPSVPKYVRYKYGAWYLKPSQWKLRPSTQPLEDPKVIKKREEMETKMKNESLDAVLMETHGAQAFKNFVALKNKNATASEQVKQKSNKSQQQVITSSKSQQTASSIHSRNIITPTVILTHNSDDHL